MGWKIKKLLPNIWKLPKSLIFIFKIQAYQKKKPESLSRHFLVKSDKENNLVCTEKSILVMQRYDQRQRQDKKIFLSGKKIFLL